MTDDEIAALRIPLPPFAEMWQTYGQVIAAHDFTKASGDWYMDHNIDPVSDALQDSLASLPENAHDAAMQRLEQIALGDTVLDIYGPGDPACEQCHGRGAIRGQFGRAQTVSRCLVCNAEKSSVR